MKHAWIALSLASGALVAGCTPKAPEPKTEAAVSTPSAAPEAASAPAVVANAAHAYSATLAPGAGITSKGAGTGSFTFDPSTKTLAYTVTFDGLSGAATMAHIHGPADPGADGGVVAPLTGSASPITGSAVLTDAQAAELAAGKYYVNVHTAANPGGEIRGQIVMAH